MSKLPADTDDLLMEQRQRYQEELEWIEQLLELYNSRAEVLERRIESINDAME